MSTMKPQRFDFAAVCEDVMGVSKGSHTMSTMRFFGVFALVNLVVIGAFAMVVADIAARMP